jgi:hypothetical protein
MSLATRVSDLFEDLSPEKQELVAGGQLTIQMDPDQMDQMDEFDNEFSQGDDFDSPRSDRRDQGFDRKDHDGGRVRVIPIRLTGVLEVMK